MNLLLVNYEYPPVGAGAATATQAIARSLSSLGHHASVLTAGLGQLVGAADEDGVRVIRVASRRRRPDASSTLEMASFIFHASRVVRHVVQSERIDAVIAFFSIPGGPVALWANSGTGVPYVVSLRGGDVPGAEPGLGLIHRALAPLRRRILRKAQAVVANSPGLKALSEASDPFSVRMIPNGVDSSFFVPPQAPRAGDSPLRLLFAGRFQRQKNLPWLLDQLAEVRRRAERPFTLELLGDGPMRRELESQAGRLGLSGIAHFSGWAEKGALRTSYQAADLVINPSLYEGMPNVVLEAMACGRPILASRVPGNDSAVVDGVTGWLFALGDAAAFQGRVLSALSAPEILPPIGAAARARAEREYSWARTAQSYLDLLTGPSPTLPRS